MEQRRRRRRRLAIECVHDDIVSRREVLRRCMRVVPARDAGGDDDEDSGHHPLLQWNHDGSLLFAGRTQTARATIRIADVARGTFPAVLSAELVYPVESVNWLGNNTVAVGYRYEHRCVLLDVGRGLQPVRSYESERGTEAGCDGVFAVGRFLTMRPNAVDLCTGSLRGKIRLFDIRQSGTRPRCQMNAPSMTSDDPSIRSIVGFSSDVLLMGIHRDGTCRLWDHRNTLTPLRTISLPDLLDKYDTKSVNHLARERLQVDSAVRLDDRRVFIQLNPSRIARLDVFLKAARFVGPAASSISCDRLHASLMCRHSLVYPCGNHVLIGDADERSSVWRKASVSGDAIAAVAGNPEQPIIACSTMGSSSLQMISCFAKR
ncbi:Uncharacterized protein PBTT_06092 [Plasmodiophora brassicae]